MYDLRIYNATRDLPGGPMYVEEQQTIEFQLAQAAEADDWPLTRGTIIGGLISLFLLAGTGIYLFLGL